MHVRALHLNAAGISRSSAHAPVTLKPVVIPASGVHRGDERAGGPADVPVARKSIGRSRTPRASPGALELPFVAQEQSARPDADANQGGTKQYQASRIRHNEAGRGSCYRPYEHHDADQIQ